MKKFLKFITTFIKCIFHRIKYNKGLYIGYRVKFTHNQKVVFGKNVSIHPFTDFFATVTIGDNCDIGTRNRFGGIVEIGNNVLFGPDNFIASNTHEYEDVNLPIIYQNNSLVNKNKRGKIIIEDDCWIGVHCAIIGDIKIGKHSIIGANSVVNRDVPDYSVVVGNPAKVVKRFNFKTNKWEKVI